VRVNLITGVIISCVVVTAILARISQFTNGDPKLYRSIPTGVVAGITSTLMSYGMVNKKKNSNNDSQ